MLPIILVALAVFAALLIWEFYICEGAHLGPGVVIRLYDIAAGRYDRIKDFDPDWETRFVGEPIAAAIEKLAGARVLDVGAGTGRVGRTLLPLTGPDLRLVCAEPSRGMLRLGRLKAPRALWVRGQADPLPFADGSFDASSA
jgi:ubiquinone/menaquinone biosynthesis C-methylase UbiE